jgi:transposase-like protein
VQGAVLENVTPGNTIMTDEDRAFLGLNRNYFHYAVNHSRGECVRGSIHANTVEGVWALLKRQLFGIHHWVSSKHLHRYLDEMTWRFNRRDMKVADRMNDVFSCIEGRLPYKALKA